MGVAVRTGVPVAPRCVLPRRVASTRSPNTAAAPSDCQNQAGPVSDGLPEHKYFHASCGLMHRSNKPSYSITSSASESSMGDGSIPSERAVLRLSAKASLVGRRTGMSAGFSPRNMRAA
jgi:hypothetical protein